MTDSRCHSVLAMIFYMSHKQERFKGRWLQSAIGGWAGTSEMGWGFSEMGFFANGSAPLYAQPGDPRYPFEMPSRKINILR